MTEQKESELSFQAQAKESIGERLRSLIGARSVRAAADDWGLKFSTLNNYLTRGTEPSLNVAIKIANVEGVSVEWIATGTDKRSVQDPEQPKALDDPLNYAWQIVYDSLDKNEVEALLRLIHKDGVNGILSAKAVDAALTKDFLLLSDDEQQRVLRLAKQVREGAPSDSEEDDLTHPTHKRVSRA
jgi:transcriptional regulator with XRE-family HTH domain